MRGAALSRGAAGMGGIVSSPRFGPLYLSGQEIRLEPLEPHHASALAAASAVDPSLYQWSPVPQGIAAAAAYIENALTWQRAGTALPFAIIRLRDEAVIGSTRFWNIEYWNWPQGHQRFGRELPDACEIGYTWFTSSAIRTRANTEAKYLMLRHAFEEWGVLRVCLHTDVRNLRSQAAMERIGAKKEGVLRSHRMAADHTARDSARYSIVATEWQDVQLRLLRLLDR